MKSLSEFDMGSEAYRGGQAWSSHQSEGWRRGWIAAQVARAENRQLENTMRRIERRRTLRKPQEARAEHD